MYAHCFAQEINIEIATFSTFDSKKWRLDGWQDKLYCIKCTYITVRMTIIFELLCNVDAQLFLSMNFQNLMWSSFYFGRPATIACSMPHSFSPRTMRKYPKIMTFTMLSRQFVLKQLDSQHYRSLPSRCSMSWRRASMVFCHRHPIREFSQHVRQAFSLQCARRQRWNVAILP